MFVLGMVPLVGGVLYLFCTKWIREVNLIIGFTTAMCPTIGGFQSVGPLWLMRLIGAILIIIGISIVNDSFGAHQLR